MKPLTTTEIQNQLALLPSWKIHAQKLHRDFQFKDFVEAFAFMTKVAKIAEQMNHHPEWSNVYNQVSVNLTTHDSKGITEKDFALAHEMEKFASAS